MRSPGVLTSRGQAFLMLGVLTALAGIVLGYRDVTRIGILLLALPLLAMVWMRRRPPSIRVLRTVSPSRMLPDERGEVRALFTNVGSSRTPMYLAEEQFDYALGDRPRFLLPRMDRGEERQLRYTIRSRHRGSYPLGPVTLRLRDPFGLTYLVMQLPRTDEALVLPRIYDLGTRGPRGQGRGTEGELPQMVALHGEDDVSIRSYRDGDELRRVHWPATAHRGELMVRQEDRPTRRRAVLLLDSRSSAHPGSVHRPSYEWAVSALASVARHLIQDGFVVHLLTEATLEDGSAAHPLDLDRIMTVLARIQPATGSAGLDPLIAAAHSFTSGGVLVVAAVVAHDEQEVRNLAAIRQPGNTAMAFVLDRSAFDAGSPTGTTRDTGTLALEGVLSESGWQTALVGPADPVAGAWEVIHGSRRSEGVR
ncbi:DUF58 domain-containing protein [Ornithinicoccus hortensis]|uniref:Uncharacterized protein (DUF58 family) n=1 Tax=Ornithinicoccus hortensis TaxID=82346 RepID=A0A542YR19_9MICO|nr:DUF58 domain-containing protein [Ornithinicoccus hortensis]TQL50528.1 uncharacterized protein (DUF58 family) [Ornithinicoccus hortensis]